MFLCARYLCTGHLDKTFDLANHFPLGSDMGEASFAMIKKIVERKAHDSRGTPLSPLEPTNPESFNSNIARECAFQKARQEEVSTLLTSFRWAVTWARQASR